jgi:two-component system cell cycle sensor histidine kinase/response regulator CckA
MAEGVFSEGLSTGLRERAEERAGADRIDVPDPLSPEEAQRVLHELRVHRIELEIQNESLRRAQEELEASRERYFDLYDLAPVGYVTLSEQGLILEANLTAAKLLGLTRGALVKQPFSLFIFPEDQDIHYRARKQLVATGAPQTWELRLVRKDAGPFWARVEAAPTQGADRACVYRAVISDVSERKRAERIEEEKKLDAQRQQLQKAESLERMAGAIAHHFNNYLMAVTGNLELAMGDLDRGGQPFDNLVNALHGARQAAEVSNLMLTYLGKTPGKHEPVDLSDICLQCLPLLRAAMAKDVVLEAVCPPPAPVVSANANEIQRVLTNLVLNAWEARRHGRSAIQVTVKMVSPAEILEAHRFPIDWRPHDDAYACLQVADEGCGIADQDIEQLFDPFFSSKFVGRGLGLAVVLGIVRAHRGAVTVESEAGRGSIFRVFLPLATDDVAGQPDQTAKSPAVAWGGTVLLIEDEQAVRKIVATMLTRLGFTVIEAADGLDAVAAFRRHQHEVRLVLCDLTMPRMNGWQTLVALRKLAPGIPVILASGYDEAQVMAGDHAEWPQAFLGKPYRLKGLRDAIGRALLHRKE